MEAFQDPYLDFPQYYTSVKLPCITGTASLIEEDTNTVCCFMGLFD